jgi:excinuclease UvrABC ATPase subunit
MTDQNTIRIRGVRQHNLKNVDLDLPRFLAYCVEIFDYH